MIDELAIALVPKSKILDLFIADGEQPSTIVAFLQQHDYMFKEICADSLYWTRLFQLDFFLKCNKLCREYILSKLPDIDIEYKAFFVWQILLSDSLKANEVKYKCRKLLNEIWRSPCAHPHASAGCAWFKSVDTECAQFATKDCILTIPMTLPKHEFERVYNGIQYSLFRARLLQYDIFAAIDIYKQYIMMSRALCLRNGVIDMNCLRFFLQVLDSGEDDKVKLAFYKKFRESIFETPEDFLSSSINVDVMRLIHECSSGEEFIMKMAIYGNDMTPYVVLQLMALRPKWIKTWAKVDKEGLDNVLSISGIADKLDKR